MMWDQNREYARDRGRKCVVCGRPTRQQVAPLGIVSGRVACCLRHEDREIISAYLAWCARLEQGSFE